MISGFRTAFSWRKGRNGILFSTITLKDAHPNTAVLRLTGEHGRKIEVQAASIGGGRILIAKLDGIEVNFSAEKPTLIVHNVDQPGHVAQVTSMLAEKQVNIATLQLYRDKRAATPLWS